MPPVEYDDFMRLARPNVEREMRRAFRHGIKIGMPLGAVTLAILVYLATAFGILKP